MVFEGCEVARVQVETSVRRGIAGVAGLVAAVLVAAGCSSGAGATPKPSPSASASAPTTVTLAVYGARPVLDTYRSLAAAFTRKHPGTVVKVLTYATHDEAVAALQEARAAGDPPDLFLADHGDLGQLEQDKALRRVDDLLSEREVDFGDGFARNGLEAFSSEAALQCMPVDVSPLVVYYNPQLIELDQLREPGRTPVSQDTGWSLDDFAVAAAQPRAPGVRGVYVAPEVEQLAPFVWSGGGRVVDDTDKPTTTKLADGSSVSALDKLLTIVRDPGNSFGPRALQRTSALRRFEQGELGMILGYRDLVPQLRARQSLTFDVMPIPRIGSSETIGSMTGLCLSAAVKHPERAADVLTYLVSDSSASALAATGYVMPANVAVVNDDAFLQTGQRPLHSTVFPRELRDIQLLPATTTWPTVRSAVDRALVPLFTQPQVLPLQDRLQAIDDASVTIFNPDATPSASPTPTPSPSPSSSSTP
ncbi:MAG: hypothetical protein JWR20_281 [Marmoricola sp.]|nr:hypothetical protein [Marmoricola sp.]